MFHQLAGKWNWFTRQPKQVAPDLQEAPSTARILAEQTEVTEVVLRWGTYELLRDTGSSQCVQRVAVGVQEAEGEDTLSF